MKVSQYSLSSLPFLAPKSPGPTPKLEQPVLTPVPSSPATPGESVTLTSSTLAPVAYPQETLETSAPSTATAPKSEVFGFRNGPLTQGLETEGHILLGYLNELSPLESRYPTVVSRLRELETQALDRNYDPVASQKLEKSVLSAPPWPTTEFGDPRANIGAKAKELQQTHPELNTQDASAYNSGQAADASDRLMETLDALFPQEEMPGLTMATRAKAPASLANKMAKMTALDPNFTLAHLTDTVGARIDAPDLASMGKVAERLEKQYEGKIIAKSDYVSQPGANGYRAIHYIVDIGGRMAEIQTSTQSLRLADLATHDTIYKTEFPVSPEAAAALSTAADRIMFLECCKVQGQT